MLAKITDVDVYNETKQYAESILKDHRFMSDKWVSHRLKIAVVGPPKSGKSVLLGELATRLFVEMAHTGEWKSTMALKYFLSHMNSSIWSTDQRMTRKYRLLILLGFRSHMLSKNSVYMTLMGIKIHHLA